MDKNSIIEALRKNPGAFAEYSDRSPTGVRMFTRVWLDGDGELVRGHPTDPKRGPIEAPEGVQYSVRTTQAAW